MSSTVCVKKKGITLRKLMQLNMGTSKHPNYLSRTIFLVAALATKKWSLIGSVGVKEGSDNKTFNS